MVLYAHSGASSDKADWQTLRDHLQNVSELAAKFAEPFDSSDWARAAGILHDAGKARPEFQLRLEGKHSPIDHAIDGAMLAQSLFPKGHGRANEGSPLAPIIAGHHGGLPDAMNLKSREQRWSEDSSIEDARKRFASLLDLVPEESIDVRRASFPRSSSHGDERYEFATFNMFLLEHLLYSSLVDADWLDTEAAMSQETSNRRLHAVADQRPLGELLVKLEQYLSVLSAEAPDTPINQARSTMLETARGKATLPPGIFSLDMPTGSGKTLTSLEFALRHAVANKQRRVIYAIPFMSIVEQNAQIMKDILGNENVLEHFSSYDFGLSDADIENENGEIRERGLRERILVQNWDAPIVVTTNVQLFESLFSNSPSRSRKVHNIASSVIVLDEVQCLPNRLLLPTLAMLESLVNSAHVSVVLCTATQPGLEDCFPFHTPVTQLISKEERHEELFSARSDIDATRLGDKSIGMDELVELIISSDESLCIVNSRRAAASLFMELKNRYPGAEGTFHLSALMVPEHRSKVIAEIKQRVAEGLPCHVVSTQLIEAGVDVDFPMVLREMTGIDSLLQAAGRCNREGRMKASGKVVVFECSDFAEFRPKRLSWLDVTRSLGEEAIKVAKMSGKDPVGPDSVKYFFTRCHDPRICCLDGSQDKPIYAEIVDREHLLSYLSDCAFPYETISERYQFIESNDVSIFIPWGESGKALLKIIEDGDASDLAIFPMVQRLSISVHPLMYKELDEAGAIRRIGSFPVPVLETRDGAMHLYDEERGLLAPDRGVMDSLII
jgi:CRISPR-associated endonuclease/helicase Cas3